MPSAARITNVKRLSVLVLAFLANLAFAGPSADSARGVLERTFGPRTKEFVLSEIPAVNGVDVYEVEASGGRVRIAGSSGVAISRGAYDYLKNACGCQVTWDGDQTKLPAVFPDFPKTRVVCPVEYRHYFNVCTFGYTMAFWDWKRWRREIDWMALHGINMPLSMTGQERVWQEVWRSFGMTDEQIRAHFVGPAFFPWQWMGNINSHAGPIPQSFLDYAAGLQKKILRAELDLGMKPVTPAFAGFVPRDFAKANPKAKIRPSAAWAGFEGTYLLDPQDPLFPEIGKRFIQQYRKMYGETAHLYLADVYNEMTPLVSPDNKLGELRAAAEAVYRSILAGDPQGTWVMQGWLFLNEASYWHTPEVEAFLGGVPDDRMILLDLAAEWQQIWQRHEAFRRKTYIWNMLHNYGQRTRLFGRLDHIAEAPAAAYNDPGKGKLNGFGITMEGIQQNTVQYELMCDAMWRTTPIDLNRWLDGWAKQRYGTDAPIAREIWTRMEKLFYRENREWNLMPYQTRSNPDAVADGTLNPEIRRLIEIMLSAPPELFKNPLFVRDFVDVAKDYIGMGANIAIQNALEAMANGNRPALVQAQKDFNALIGGLDGILANVPQHRMDNWIAMARACLKDTAEKNYMERNARMQVTVWGGPVLSEYAAKEWAGLLNGYYRERWNRLFDAYLKTGSVPANFVADQEKWDFAWCDRTDLPKPKPSDLVTSTRKLLELCSQLKPVVTPAGIAVGKPTTDSGHTEQGADPGKAVDGRIGGGYWAANPYPQWWQVDLQAAETIDRVQVVTYSGDGRYYQYTVQTSLDGKSWTTVVDFSKNTEVASGRGTTHKFAPVSARYVRVNMLFNSANVGVHLREVRVFRPGS